MLSATNTRTPLNIFKAALFSFVDVTELLNEAFNCSSLFAKVFEIIAACACALPTSFKLPVNSCTISF